MGWACGAGRSDSTAVQRDQGVEMCACGPCATTAACSSRRACAAAWGSDSHRLVSPWCAAQDAPCKRPGRWAAGRRARGAWGDCGGARHAHAVLPCCCPAYAIQSPPQRLGQTLGFRHTAWHRVRHAVCEERDGARAMGAGCEGAGRAADVVAAAPHLRGAARWGVAAF